MPEFKFDISELYVLSKPNFLVWCTIQRTMMRAFNLDFDPKDRDRTDTEKDLRRGAYLFDENKKNYSSVTVENIIHSMKVRGLTDENCQKAILHFWPQNFGNFIVSSTVVTVLLRELSYISEDDYPGVKEPEVLRSFVKPDKIGLPGYKAEEDVWQFEEVIEEMTLQSAGGNNLSLGKLKCIISFDFPKLMQLIASGKIEIDYSDFVTVKAEWIYNCEEKIGKNLKKMAKKVGNVYKLPLNFFSVDKFLRSHKVGHILFSDENPGISKDLSEIKVNIWTYYTLSSLIDSLLQFSREFKEQKMEVIFCRHFFDIFNKATENEKKSFFDLVRKRDITLIVSEYSKLSDKEINERYNGFINGFIDYVGSLGSLDRKTTILGKFGHNIDINFAKLVQLPRADVRLELPRTMEKSYLESLRKVFEETDEVKVQLMGCDEHIRKVLSEIKTLEGVEIEIILSGAEREDDRKKLFDEEIAKLTKEEQKRVNIIPRGEEASKALSQYRAQYSTFFKPHVGARQEVSRPQQISTVMGG